MKPNNKYYIGLILAVTVCSALMLSWFYRDELAARKTAPFQKTDDWMRWRERLPEGENADRLESNAPDIPIEKKPAVLLRVDSSNGNLLLKHNYGEEVYLYEPATGGIRQASEEDWSKAGGEITNCRSQISGEYNLEISFEAYPGYRVKHKETVLETYGKYALAARESPNRTKAAIVSAAGPLKRPSSGYVGLGGSEPVVYGTRYVQIVQLDNQKSLQEPVKLNPSDGKYEFALCWSKDEKYVIAYQPYENFSVIETNGVVR